MKAFTCIDEILSFCAEPCYPTFETCPPGVMDEFPLIVDRLTSRRAVKKVAKGKAAQHASTVTSPVRAEEAHVSAPVGISVTEVSAPGDPTGGPESSSHRDGATPPAAGQVDVLLASPPSRGSASKGDALPIELSDTDDREHPAKRSRTDPVSEPADTLTDVSPGPSAPAPQTFGYVRSASDLNLFGRDPKLLEE